MKNHLYAGLLMTACATSLLMAPAWAEYKKDMHAMHGMDHKPMGKMSASTKELMAANAAMHKEMDITYTHDVDIDFLRGMIAHHQGAVEMAEVQLKYGKNPQVRRLSQDIIRAQKLEIRWMQRWLAQLEAQPKTFSDTATGSGSWSDTKWTGDDGVWMGER